MVCILVSTKVAEKIAHQVCYVMPLYVYSQLSGNEVHCTAIVKIY